MCEVPLWVSPSQEKVLLARLEAARRLYNACLGEALKRVKLIQQSRLWQKAWKAGNKDLRNALIREACSKYGFTDAALQHYAVETRRSCWIGEHLDVHVAQKLGTRAYRAARKVETLTSAFPATASAGNIRRSLCPSAGTYAPAG
ncbi:hypothetical protein [Ammonifex degensii]|uniref:hypothetical protein n=1 Tax=Ammonifex degensii TaxID=42838 RepID=UPI00145F1681|nr:hypothetical protein [Ammonifex degensii]